MNKIKPRDTNPLRLLKHQNIDTIVNSLFPSDDYVNNDINEISIIDNEETDIVPISNEDIGFAMEKMCARKTAPGPDGLSEVIFLEIYVGAPE